MRAVTLILARDAASTDTPASSLHCVSATTHLSDDKAVAKVGHPRCDEAVIPNAVRNLLLPCTAGASVAPSAIKKQIPPLCCGITKKAKRATTSGCPSTASLVREALPPERRVLPLAGSACQCLWLLLVGAAGSRACCLRRCGLACGALYLFALYGIGHALGVCHSALFLIWIAKLRGAPTGQTSPPASSRHAVEIVL